MVTYKCDFCGLPIEGGEGETRPAEMCGAKDASGEDGHRARVCVKTLDGFHLHRDCMWFMAFDHLSAMLGVQRHVTDMMRTKAEFEPDSYLATHFWQSLNRP